ncbi:metallophosphoesterase [Cognatishimia sp. MH4019]|uniref:metallophosphoesterase n=1 Tax=Cognatishimia sp. MH4019 TaxID=2854030 RepID=UPI001CD6C0BD|nr:metallophosphoesterase [Cognatishimia sp. MH4019]
MGLLKRMMGAPDAHVEALRLPEAEQTDLGLPQPRMPVYVIGDIHGRLDLFEDLLARIDLDIGSHEVGAPVLVCVGDYIDRGEDSKAVLMRMRALNVAQPARFICLMGNHERMMLEFLQQPDRRRARWLRHGGLQTLASFGLGGVTETSPLPALEAVADGLRAVMPDGLEAWMHRLPKMWKSGSLVCVHAAADPGTPLKEQSRHTLLWGHPEFFDRPRQDGLWVAHGHTAMPSPRFEQSRISLDTGAYVSGMLSAARVLPDGSVNFIWT